MIYSEKLSQTIKFFIHKMGVKITEKEFLKRAKAKHGDKFNYEKNDI